MKKTFVFGLCAAFALLAALVFSGCPAEEEIPSAGTYIKLTNIPEGILKENIFLAVFTNKAEIKPGPGNIFIPLGGAKALVVGQWSWWSDGAIPFTSWAGTTGDYVLVFGVSSTQNESDPAATTYATNGQKNDLALLGGAPLSAIRLTFINGVATVDFDNNFMHTGSRPNLLEKLGDGTY
jgi:hypothetical protein